MEAGYQVEQGILRIFVPQELDHHVAEKIRLESEMIIDQRQINQVDFDFSQTQFMDSSGIGVIIGRVKRMRQLRGRVTATHVSGQVYRILRMAGLTEVITISRQEDPGIAEDPGREKFGALKEPVREESV